MPERKHFFLQEMFPNDDCWLTVDHFAGWLSTCFAERRMGSTSACATADPYVSFPLDDTCQLIY